MILALTLLAVAFLLWKSRSIVLKARKEAAQEKVNLQFLAPYHQGEEKLKSIMELDNKPIEPV